MISWHKHWLTPSGTDKKKLKVIAPPPSALKTCKDPISVIQQSQLDVLDPTGERKALFDYRRNPRSVKVGDILRVTFRSGDPFSGVCLNIRSRGIDTSFLLRNNLTRVGVEMWIKVFSPNVESVEIVQRTEKRKRRARLYYMRYVSLGAFWRVHEFILATMDSSFAVMVKAQTNTLPQASQARHGYRREYCAQLPPTEVCFDRSAYDWSAHRRPLIELIRPIYAPM